MTPNKKAERKSWMSTKARPTVLYYILNTLVQPFMDFIKFINVIIVNNTFPNDSLCKLPKPLWTFSRHHETIQKEPSSIFAVMSLTHFEVTETVLMIRMIKY